MMSDKFCVIVDPYISTASICDALHACNIKVIGLLTDLKIDEDEKTKRFPKNLFDMVCPYNEMTIPLLQKYNVSRVISGTDASVEIADELAHYLTPQFANPNQTSANRNNKFLMQEALRQKGIPAVPQVSISHKILTQEDKQRISSLSFPLFIKPTHGLCSYGARKCDSMSEVETAAREIMGTVNFLGEKVEEMTVQECLVGDEYYIDTVSLSGEHKIVSLFRYKKSYLNSMPIYRSVEIVDLYSDAGIVIVDYIKKVLNALGLNNGFAHTEIFLTPKGPYLIELNPRISGFYGCGNKIAKLCYGLNQANLLAESIIDPNDFIVNYQELPKLELFGMFICLQVWSSRKLKKFNIEKAASLPSYQSHLIIFDEGTLLHPPKSLTDTIGFILLTNKNKEQLKMDADKIIQWESEEILY